MGYTILQTKILHIWTFCMLYRNFLQINLNYILSVFVNANGIGMIARTPRWRLNIKMSPYHNKIPMLKMKLYRAPLIFNMGIPYLIKTVYILKRGLVSWSYRVSGYIDHIHLLKTDDVIPTKKTTPVHGDFVGCNLFFNIMQVCIYGIYAPMFVRLPFNKRRSMDTFHLKRIHHIIFSINNFTYQTYLSKLSRQTNTMLYFSIAEGEAGFYHWQRHYVSQTKEKSIPVASFTNMV